MTKLYSAAGQFRPTPPFDFEKSLDFMAMFPPMHGEQSLAPRALAKTVSVNGKPVFFQLQSRGTLAAPCLDYTLYAQNPIDASLEHAAQDRIRFFLSLDDDLPQFYKIGLADPSFEHVLRRLYGLHQVKFLTPFEIACWAVINRRTPLSAAKRVKQAIIEEYGSHLDVNGTRYWAFPEPARMKGAEVSDLSELTKNERKAEYLYAVVRAFAGVDEVFLRSGDYEEVRQWLLGIKGIGEWSAHFVMLRGLGRMERLHITRGSIYEKRLSEAVSRVYAPGKTLGAEAIQGLAHKYGEWQGYWAYYLRSAAD